MSNLKGSKTEENLLTAFAGESMARSKYTYFASQAKKEGYEQIANIFLETANNEKEHAKLWYKLLHDGIADTMSKNIMKSVIYSYYKTLKKVMFLNDKMKNLGFV